jgi:hypothetical protein
MSLSTNTVRLFDVENLRALLLEITYLILSLLGLEKALETSELLAGEALLSLTACCKQSNNPERSECVTQAPVDKYNCSLYCPKSCRETMHATPLRLWRICTVPYRVYLSWILHHLCDRFRRSIVHDNIYGKAGVSS